MKAFKITYRLNLSSIEPIQTSIVVAEDKVGAINEFYKQRSREYYDIDVISELDLKTAGEVK